MIIGSIMNNLGNNLMSLGHKEEAELEMKRSMSAEKYSRNASREKDDALSPLTTFDDVLDIDKDRNGQKNSSTKNVSPRPISPMKPKDDGAVDVSDATALQAAGAGAGQTILDAPTTPLKIGDENSRFPATSFQTPGQDVAAFSDDGMPEEEPRCSWWLIGTIIFVIGALLAFLSFGFAAQSLLAALESVQFVSNVIFSKYVHGIEVTRTMIIATCTICVGNIMVVIFSTHSSKILNTKQVTLLYHTNWYYHIYLGISGSVWFLMAGGFLYYKKKRLEGVIFWKHKILETLMYVIMATLLGAQVVLLAKALSMLMQLCIYDKNQFATAYASTLWAILVAWIVSAFAYVLLINYGLKLYNPAFFIPSLTVFFIIFTITSGGVFFYEFSGMSTIAMVFFAVGVLLIFVGVWNLAPTESTAAVVPVLDDPQIAEYKKTPGSPVYSTPEAAKLFPTPLSTASITAAEEILSEIEAVQSRIRTRSVEGLNASNHSVSKDTPGPKGKEENQLVGSGSSPRAKPAAKAKSSPTEA
jgi:hypothetical protein